MSDKQKYTAVIGLEVHVELKTETLGAVIYYIVIQFVLTAGLNTNDLKLITALVVAIFLAIPYWKGKYFRAAVKTKKEGR